MQKNYWILEWKKPKISSIHIKIFLYLLIKTAVSYLQCLTIGSVYVSLQLHFKSLSYTFNLDFSFFKLNLILSGGGA